MEKQPYKGGYVPGFSSQYGVSCLVWFELHETIPHAAEREKAIKKWRRQWKVRLIETMNPDWKDLYDEIA
jgi:putative endonuclease